MDMIGKIDGMNVARISRPCPPTEPWSLAGFARLFVVVAAASAAGAMPAAGCRPFEID
jgi:hypothetical protein